MFLLTTIFADTTTDGWGHMGGWGGGWMWLWGVAMMVLFTTSLIWLLRGFEARPTHNPEDRARAILAERYANGDLSTEEYRERVTEIR